MRTILIVFALLFPGLLSAQTTSLPLKPAVIAKISEDIVKLSKSSDKPLSIVNILHDYSWINPIIFKGDIDQSITLNTPPSIRVKIFSRVKPQSDRNKLLLWEAKTSITAKSPTKLPDSWLSAELSPSEEKSFFNKYRHLLTSAAVKARMSNLLWSQQKKNISILQQYLSKNASREFIHSTAIIDKNPTKTLLANQYSSYLYIKKLITAEHYQQASSLVLSMNFTNLTSLQIEKWWKIRHLLARENIKVKKYAAAYKLSLIASTDSAIIADSQWLSGWISLRFLKNPALAISHFHAVYEHATMSDTKAKASYWLWKSYLAKNNAQEANNWLNIATSYHGFFYGQVAALESGQQHLSHFSDAQHYISTHNPAKNHIILGMFLYKQGYPSLANRVILAATDYSMSIPESNDLANMVATLHNQELNVLFAKKLANNHNINLQYGYPVDLKISGKYPSLYYAIIRQESNFNANAQSPVGAFGLMQLMPKTAAQLSKKLNIHPKSYRSNVKHNIASGSEYLNSLKAQLNHSYIATIASYNAGKSNVTLWIKSNGDPTQLKKIDNIIDWIESIPFSETRFYVKKVIANMVIYDHILNPQKTKQSSLRNLKSYLS